MQHDKMSDYDVASQRIIATFMSGSSPMEQYLQEQRPLTDLQLQSLSLTIANLQAFLDAWKQKHGDTEATPRFKSDLP